MKKTTEGEDISDMSEMLHIEAAVIETMKKGNIVNKDEIKPQNATEEAAEDKLGPESEEDIKVVVLSNGVWILD